MHKAKHHAQKAIQAVDSGDLKLAAHHFGHALASLKQSQSNSPDGMEEMAETPAPTMPAGMPMRDRLKSFKRS